MGAYELVREFHHRFGVPIRDHPAMPSVERREMRQRLIAEEFAEFCAANRADDLVEAADALVDLLYVIYGACVEYGIRPKPLFEEVHRSNMSKLGPNGIPLRRSDGKILKGPNYSPPNLAPLLKAQKKHGPYAP